MSTSMNELIGKNIKEIYVDADQQHALRFVTADGEELYYESHGDCCSESWFADIIGVKALLGQRIDNVTELELPQDPKDGRGRQESDEVYGHQLTTKLGSADIIYRNSSNGYYNGWCTFMGDQLAGKYTWKQITDDWKA